MTSSRPTPLRYTLPWFILSLVGLVQSAHLLHTYWEDFAYLRGHGDSPLRRELAYSNLRNEIGRLGIFCLFHFLGIAAHFPENRFLNRIFLPTLFYLIALFKVYSSYKDANLRLRLLTENG